MARPEGSMSAVQAIQDVFLLLDDGPKTAKQLGMAMDMDPRSARRYLAFLVECGDVEYTVRIRRFSRVRVYSLVRCPCCGKKAA